jgi:hypothetical protein
MDRDSIGGTAPCGCADELRALRAEVAELRAAVDQLATPVVDRAGHAPVATRRPAAPTVDRDRIARQRLALFRSLFVGREDVYAQR